MLPLLLLLLGGAITAYGLSPGVKTRVDEFVRSIRSADVAHQAADANLSRANEATNVALQAATAAQEAASAAWRAATAWTQPFTSAVPATPDPSAAPPPDLEVYAPEATEAAVDFAAAATEANREAARETSSAAMNAQTDDQRRAAAESAGRVLEREQEIAEALRTLGIGECDVQTYYNVTSAAKDTLLTKLNAEGMTVTGNNPWNLDTGEHGVKLRAIWDFRSNELKLIVTSKQFYVPCSEVWKRIDPKLKEVVGAWYPWGRWS